MATVISRALGPCSHPNNRLHPVNVIRASWAVDAVASAKRAPGRPATSACGAWTPDASPQKRASRPWAAAPSRRAPSRPHRGGHGHPALAADQQPGVDRASPTREKQTPRLGGCRLTRAGGLSTRPGQILEELGSQQELDVRPTQPPAAVIGYGREGGPQVNRHGNAQPAWAGPPPATSQPGRHLDG